MRTLRPAPISTRQLTWLPSSVNGPMFVSEMSSTNGFGRVYEDSCDVGLTLVSERTGAERVFVQVSDRFDAGGERVSWILKDTTPGSELHIELFND